MSLTVATYFWYEPGTKFSANYVYTPDDVRLLQRMVKRNLTVPHEFVVITDRPHLFEEDEEIRAVPIDWAKHVPGTCFVRLFTFSPAARELIGECVLQLDLDCVIVGDMDDLVNRNEDLVLWHNPRRVPWDGPDADPRLPWYNTSILLHKCGTMTEIWKEFDPSNVRFRDDQWWISAKLGPDMPYWDRADGIYRNLIPNRPGTGVQGELPENAKIVFFPGSAGKAHDAHMIEANPWIKVHRW